MAIVRVVDQYNFPLLLRELGRAIRGGDTNIAHVVDRANTFVLCVSELSPADRLAIVELSRRKGMEAVLARPRDPGRSEQLDVLTMGTFAQYLALTDEVKELGPTMLRIGSEMKRAIFDYRERVFEIETPGGTLSLGRDTVVMGVLNLTPDSFSDGGKYDTKDKAVKRAREIADEGAGILDLGGESTRPGADPVKPADEAKRILPVLEALLKADYPIPISVDTRNASTAEKALAAGASIVNDVSGLRHDSAMAGVVARAAVPLILTHSRGTPKDMAEKAVYHDLPAEVIAELRDGMSAAREAGIDPANVLLDPGVGFAKDADQSIEVLRSLQELRTLGRPIVVGPSRKSFLKKLGADSEEARAGVGTGAAVAACAYSGAHVVRVHEVAQAVAILKVVDGIRRLS
ncbi:MAG TPA: dihydropteroate synthase [Planctomycetota bacterium]|nr:dihydropteroate synthase [Planctomycetota bacterium]